MNLTLRAAVGSTLLGDITWKSAVLGYCKCPGASLHSTQGRGARRECRVNLDGAPTLFCLHQSCAGVIADLNRELRSQIARAEAEGHAPRPTDAELRRRERERHERADRERREQKSRHSAATAKPNILKRYAWSEAEAWEDSPTRLEGPPSEDGRLLLACLYRSSDGIWIGDKHDSGDPRHAPHFRTMGEWLDCADLAGPLICPATFGPGAYSRSEVNIAARPFLVLEGDEVDAQCAAKLLAHEPLTEQDKARNRAGCLAVLNFLRRETPLILRAVVDSGGKSAHGWFQFPDAPSLDALRRVLPGLGFDPATLRAAQPVRLPGVRRDGPSGRWQRLLYLNPPVLWPKTPPS